jgi:predicted phosphodiesterase
MSLDDEFVEFDAQRPKTKKEQAADLKHALAVIEREGFVVHKPEPAAEVVEFDTTRVKGDRVRIGIVSDTHAGSKYQQRTHLTEFMRYAAKVRKVDCFIHGGDATDGPFEAHRGAIHEMWTGTYDGQRDAFLSQYPDTGKTTYMISGNHDEFFLKNAGGDIVRDICDRRSDLAFLGNSQGYIRFGDVLVAVMHPHDGGAYALSYKLQRRIEALSPENKPNVLLLGNYHKAIHLPAYRNTEGFLLPSFQSQSAWMAAKGIASIVGGIILEFGIATKGLAPSLMTEWVLYRETIESDW